MSSPQPTQEVEATLRTKKHQKMMRRGNGCPIRILATDTKKTSLGEIRHLRFTPGEKVLRAVKFFGLFLGLAVVSILIPVAHFILVPGFFLTALIGPYFIYQKQSTLPAGEGVCPECRSPLIIEENDDEWPIHLRCDKCSAYLTIT